MSQLTEIIKELSGRHSADIFILSGNINDNTADQLINYIRRLSTKNKNCILILTTYGGDPDAGYRIARCIKQYYQKPGKFILYVFGYCKSTGTLIALGADEIVVGDLAEFGPLDIQLDQADEFASTSGLSYLQSLISLNERIYSSFESHFMNLKAYGITTKTAAEIGSKLATGIVQPIAAQVDPLKLGEVQRAIKIASAYGERILGNTNSDIESVKKLIADYPSHSFVVDFEEMKDLFKSKIIRRPTEEEYKIEEELQLVVRKPKKDLVFHCATPSETDEKVPVKEHKQEHPPKKDSKNGKENKGQLIGDYKPNGKQ